MDSNIELYKSKFAITLETRFGSGQPFIPNGIGYPQDGRSARRAYYIDIRIIGAVPLGKYYSKNRRTPVGIEQTIRI
ncbi:MAG: hypothetical protein K6T94_22335 [Paenibacillus sp.]|nr:hypothetical protein [Paenibacillus sp.]